MEKLSTALTEKSAEFDQISEKLDTIFKSSTDLESELSKTRSEKETLQLTNDQVTAEVEKLKAELSEVADKMLNSENDLEKEMAEMGKKSKTEIESLATKLTTAENELEQIKKERKIDQDDQTSIITELTKELTEYSEKAGSLSEQMKKLEKDKDETINSILLEKEKLTTELGEKLEAEITGREAAVKGKEKLETKYEDLKHSNNETKQMLQELVESGNAVQFQLDGLKEMNLKMEEEIKNLKLQKTKDNEKLRDVEKVKNILLQPLQMS